MDMPELDQYRDNDGFVVLEPTHSDAYKRINMAPTKSVVIDTIREYDIKSANLSALRKSGKISDETLDKLSALSKDERERAVGKMIRSDKHFNEIIKAGIVYAKAQLFRYNNIMPDDVLTIKNDAVYVIGSKPLPRTKFGPFEFIVKSEYKAFHHISGVEVYYIGKGKVDISGVSNKVLATPDHQNGMLVFFGTIMRYLTSDQYTALRKYLVDFIYKYKNRLLPREYYRELNSSNIYRTRYGTDNYILNIDTAGTVDMDILSIVYNYTKYVLPFAQLYI